jgi:sugar phosphate isomerase/epimerase
MDACAGLKKIGLFTLPRADMTNLEGVCCAKEMGLIAFEPFAGNDLARPDPEAASRLRDRASSAGISMPCLSVVADLFGPSRAAEAERLKRYARIAAQMGIPLLHHTLFPALDCCAAEVPYREVLNAVVPLAREVYDDAADRGVRCVYEDQGLYFNGLKRFQWFLGELDRDADVVLDLGNTAFALEDCAGFARAFVKRIVHVHVKDYAIRPSPAPRSYRLKDGRYAIPAVVGEGDMGIAEALKILARAGYDGYYMLEHEPTGDAAGEQQRCAENLGRMLRGISGECCAKSRANAARNPR